jgi:hypothetical protein
VSLTNPVLKHRKLLCVRFYHCRYIKRGADERGDVANFVETEQIVKSLDGAAVSSFVQVSIVQNYCCKRFPCHLDYIRNYRCAGQFRCCGGSLPTGSCGLWCLYSLLCPCRSRPRHLRRT